MATRVIDKDQHVYTLERPEHLTLLLSEGLRDFYLADHPRIKITLDPSDGEVSLSDVQVQNVFYSLTLFEDLKFPIERGLSLYAKCELLRALVDFANDEGIKSLILKRHLSESEAKWINLTEQEVGMTLAMLMKLPKPAFGLFRKSLHPPTPLQVELAAQLKKIGIDQIKSLIQVEQILTGCGLTEKLNLMHHS